MIDKTKDVMIIVLLIVIVYILNTTYTIQVNDTQYSQKIYDYMLGKE